jgi:hypothetical protein
MTSSSSDDPLERLVRSLLRVLGLGGKSDEPPKEEPKPKPDVSDLQAGMQAIRHLLQKVGAALGAAGAALMTGLGYTQIHKIFPLPAGSSGWLFVLAVAGSAGGLIGAAWLAARFFGAQRRILISSEQEDGGSLRQWRLAKRKGFTNFERELRDEVFDEQAGEDGAKTLRGLELRALRYERIARREKDEARAKAFQAEADRLQGNVRLALVQAAAAVLERRSHQAFKGLFTAIPLLLAIAGIIVVFGLADWSQGQRDLISLRKSCAEAQKAGAVNACEPVVAKKDRSRYPAQEPGTPWLNGFRVKKLLKERTGYRVYGAGSQRTGQWVTTSLPQSESLAREGLALPPANSAKCVVTVRLPPGTAVRIGHVGPAFGEPGGLAQIQVVSAKKEVKYFADRPLPPSKGPCP